MYSNELVINILNYLDNNINKRITMSELSDEFYYNKDYLMRIFKKELGITIMDYINKIRIYNSLNEIRSTDDLMIKVALNNGFASQEYFSETFTKILGVNPLTYRKFTKINSQITEDMLDSLRYNLTELSSIIRRIDLYKNNVPTKEVKSLSFFK